MFFKANHKYPHANYDLCKLEFDINYYFAVIEQRTGFQHSARVVMVGGFNIVTIQLCVSFYGRPRHVNLLCLVQFSLILLALISLSFVLVPMFFCYFMQHLVFCSSSCYLALFYQFCLITPKVMPQHRFGLHSSYFSNSWFFRVYMSGCGVFLELL